MGPNEIKKQLRIGSLSAVLCCAVLLFASYYHDTRAQMSSGNYEIPVDAVDVGGGRSSSGNFDLTDSVGEVGSGTSNSANYRINAGFLAAQVVYLAVSAPVDVTMNPAISGVAGGMGMGSVTWTVTTDNAAGYSMSVKSSTNPALRSASDSFANYTPVGANPDYNWTISANDSEFGFSPEGADIIQRFKDNGSVCNAGSSDTVDRCWDALTTSGVPIVQRTTANHPSGTTTTLKIQAEAGGNHLQPSGAYSSVVEVTALPL